MSCGRKRYNIPDVWVSSYSDHFLQADFWPAFRDAHDKREFRVFEIREELKTLRNTGTRPATQLPRH
jgi:hypothetical protein